MIKSNSHCSSGTMPTLRKLLVTTEFVHQMSPTLPSCYASVRKGAAWKSAVILSDGRRAQTVVMHIFTLQQGTAQPVRPKPSLSSAALWDRSVCSTVPIGACNSQQDLGLLLISFVLALAGLTPAETLQGFLQGQRLGFYFPST